MLRKTMSGTKSYLFLLTGVLVMALFGGRFFSSDFINTFVHHSNSNLESFKPHSSSGLIEAVTNGQVESLFETEERSNEEDADHCTVASLVVSKSIFLSDLITTNKSGINHSIPLYILFQSWKHFLS